MRLHMLIALLFAMCTARVGAQCGWISNGQPPGVAGQVNALKVLPGGDLLVGGSFSTAGGEAASNIARWDGTTWSALRPGTGVPGNVRAIEVLSNGDLVAAGSFALGGEQPAKVARWDGTSWSTLGGVVNGDVSALAVLPSGQLVAGGSFTTAGGVAVNRIARWNGATWSALGSGVNGQVYALVVLPNGQLVAGGSFTTAGGVTANRIARWNGTSWSALGSGIDGVVSSLTVLPGGDVVAGGTFTAAGGVPANNVAKWNGTTWSAMGEGVTGNVTAVTALPSGEVAANGPSGGSYRVMRWDGSAWSALGLGMSGQSVGALAVLANGQLVAGGAFDFADGVLVNGIAAWNGSRWSGLGAGFDIGSLTPRVSALVVLPNGDLVAGGTFDTVGGVRATNIARWNGATWSAFGSGLGPVRALAVLATGELVAGGDGGVRRWDGTAWRPVGSGFSSPYSLKLLPSGELVAAGGDGFYRNIARWDGTNWVRFGSGFDGIVKDVAVRPGGELIAGGIFASSGGASVRFAANWTGTRWSQLGTSVSDTILSLAVLPNGDLIAGGQFRNAGALTVNGIARWDGTQWSALGTGLTPWGGPGVTVVHAMIVLPNGDLIAGGVFRDAGGVRASGIARWTGTSWSPLGSGVTSLTSPYGLVSALAVLPNGDLVVGGEFKSAGGIPSSCLAFYRGGAMTAADPVSMCASPGASAAFEVAAVGVDLQYQWRVNGADILGANGVTYAIEAVSPEDAGLYDCVVTDACGTATSAAAALEFEGPVVTIQPEPLRTLVAGMELSVGVPERTLNTYQWRRDGEALADGPGEFSGSTGRVLTILADNHSLSGTYECVLENACGVTTTAATVVRCVSDFNADGAVDSDDVIVYFSLWDAGDPSADVSGDGGVNADDVVVFFGRWDGGC